jgi:hypothetical protein
MPTEISAFVASLRELSDEQLTQDLYATRTDIQNLGRLKAISRDARRTRAWAKEQLPLLKAEVARRNLQLPGWVTGE